VSTNTLYEIVAEVTVPAVVCVKAELKLAVGVVIDVLPTVVNKKLDVIDAPFRDKLFSPAVCGYLF
tara:strand:- start:21246 stop:21443 length:198 start_codon:yes stop_codon:yes gene_type:complete